MRRRHYPRLLRWKAAELLQNIDELARAAVPAPREVLERLDGTTVPGGRDHLVPAEHVERIRRGMLECRERAKEPDPRRTERTTFDRYAAMWWGENRDLMPPREGLEPGVWAWIDLVLLPDLAVWRADGRNPARFMGGTRDVFRRLWVRGVSLDRGPEAGRKRWELLQFAQEDNLVQVFERTSLAASPIVAREAVEGLLRYFRRGGRNLQEVHRRAMLLLRAEMLVTPLDLLASQGDLPDLVDWCYERAERLAG